MTKPLFGKESLLFCLMTFGVALLALLVFPMLAGYTQVDGAFALGQAVIIAIAVAVGFAWFFGRNAEIEQVSAASRPSREISDTHVDPLTHLPNQRELTVKLLELMALGERYGNNLAVAVISIDHLHDLSEEYDQQVSNQALTAIAAELADTLRMPDRLGRWEDDQFIAVLPETSLEGARNIGERLREAVSRAQFEGRRGIELTLTASIGVTIYRLGDDLQSLLSRASGAMQAAQEQGCNRVHSDLAA